MCTYRFHLPCVRITITLLRRVTNNTNNKIIREKINQSTKSFVCFRAIFNCFYQQTYKIELFFSIHTPIELLVCLTVWDVKKTLGCKWTTDRNWQFELLQWYEWWYPIVAMWSWHKSTFFLSHEFKSQKSHTFFWISSIDIECWIYSIYFCLFTFWFVYSW